MKPDHIAQYRSSVSIVNIAVHGCESLRETPQYFRPPGASSVRVNTLWIKPIGLVRGLIETAHDLEELRPKLGEISLKVGTTTKIIISTLTLILAYWRTKERPINTNSVW